MIADPKIGERVWLFLRPAPWRPEEQHFGVIVDIDNGPLPGIQITLDQPAMTAGCYATRGEVHRAAPREDGAA